MPRLLCRLMMFAAIGAAGVTAAPAQESRAGQIAAQQEEKEKKLRAPEASVVERVLTRVERIRLDPPPVMVVFDSVYSGGGFTTGARMSRHIGDRASWGATGLISLKNYQLVEVDVLSPGHLSGRLDLSAAAGWRDATQVGYYGLGTGTLEESRANYRMKQAYFNGGAAYRPAPWLPLAGRLSYEDFQLESGKGDEPSIETIYTPATAPGLGDSPAFVHGQVQAAIDTRRSPDYARTGGHYGLAFHRYHDPAETYSFDRVDVSAVQHIPILRETWVVSLRARVETTIGDDSVVPYFMLPSLGGGSSLRGYSSWRFRDRHSLLTNVEWRWTPNIMALDMAVFFDAGRVATRRADLDLKDLVTNWGIGVRFHGPLTTPLRIELAKGAEGWHLVFGSSAAF
jgi:hypothetical protein